MIPRSSSNDKTPSPQTTPTKISPKLTHHQTDSTIQEHHNHQTFGHELVSSLLMHFDILHMHNFDNATSPQRMAIQYHVNSSLSENTLLNDPNHFHQKDWKKVQALCNVVELYVLALLYFSTQGQTNWFRTHGWLNPALRNPCTWYGITCSSPSISLNSSAYSFSHTIVTHVNLNHNGLIGTMRTELQYLYSLLRLDVPENTLSGTLPTIILSNLPFLQMVHVNGNLLTGSLLHPYHFGGGSVAANDNSNRTGTCTTAISKTKNQNDVLFLREELLALVLSRNQIHGSIPDIIRRMTNLEHLEVNDSNLSGTLPTCFLGSIDEIKSIGSIREC